MIWKVASKDFLLSLMTFKFAVGTALCVILVGVFVPVLAKAYQERFQTYNANVSYNEGELRKVTVYKNITPTIYRRPSVLAVFSEGVERQLGASATIEYDQVPEISAATANHYLSIFSVFDASLIFKIVMSVLALLVAYDTVSGERERGTLKLMLSGTVARYKVLAGKFLAGLLVLIVPVAVAFLLGLLILLCFPMTRLAGSDWIRLGVMFLASLVFVAAMYNLGLLFSCLARRSAVSLVLGLFVWIIFTLIVPNASVYLATHMVRLEPEETLNEQIGSLQRDAQQESNTEFMKLSASFQGGGSRNDMPGKGGFGRGYVRSCNRAFMHNMLLQQRITVPIAIKYAEKYWQVRYDHLRGLFDQKQFADNLARVSPICVYENIMATLAGTDMASFQRFIEAVRVYRNDIVEYLQVHTENFTAASFFTPCTEEEMERGSVNDDAPPLALHDLPRFRYEADVTGALRRVLPDLALLVLTNVLFFAAAVAAFLRYDVR